MSATTEPLIVVYMGAVKYGGISSQNREDVDQGRNRWSKSSIDIHRLMSRTIGRYSYPYQQDTGMDHVYYTPTLICQLTRS